MAIQFVLGATGTGKTVHILDEMFRNQSQYSANTQLFIVPEQYTLKAQEEFLQHTHANGLMHIEIISFNRLVNRYQDILGIADKTLMDDISFTMIVRKLIQQHHSEFVWISKNAKQQSFYEEISKIIKECYQYQIPPDRLLEFSSRMSEQLLQDKLKDLSLLLGYLIEAQKENYLLVEEASRQLSQCLIKEAVLSETPVYIDGFYGFTPLQYLLLESIILTSPKVTICVTIPSDTSLGDMLDETDLFYESKKIISKIREIAQNHFVEEIDPIILERMLRKQSPSIQHLSRNLFRYPVMSYNDHSTGIRCVESVSIKDEVENVALKIHQLIYERNYRYRDIVVLASDLESYKEEISIIFEEYKFNFFLDQKEQITQHPITQFILSALLIHQYNFRYEHVFYHLKSIFYAEEKQIEELENYCLKVGIKGYSRWSKQWNAFEDEKKMIMENLFVFHQEMQLAKTIKEKVQVIYHFLQTSQIESKSLSFSETLFANGLSQDAVAYEQVYTLILKLFEQMVELIGTEPITKDDFTVLIESGLSQVRLGQTPVNVDQLLVGQMNRSRFKEVKAIFVLGMNEGKVPLINSAGSLLTDLERVKLADQGIELAPTQEQSLFKEHITIFMSMTKCTHLLHLSYSRQGLEEILRPASLFLSILKMFPKINLESAADYIEKNSSITRILPMYKKLIRLVSKEDKAQDESQINVLYNLTKQVYNQKGGQTLINPKIFFQGINYQNTSVLLDPLPSGDYAMSVSEMESYNTCPYQYFLEYRLKINERKEFIISMPDIGNLFHACMERYLKKCLLRKLDIALMDANTRNKLIEETVAELLNEDSYKIFLSTYQNKYLIIKLTRILKRAIWGIEQHISRHILRPKELEYKFNGKSMHIEPLKVYETQDTHLYLKGVVDRIDEYETDAEVLFSIIDYKSSHSDIDFNLVNKGVQLQLFVYLDVVKSIKEHGSLKTVVPVGLYYYHIQDPYIKIEDEDFLNKIGEAMELKPVNSPHFESRTLYQETTIHDQFADERIKLLSPKGFALYQERFSNIVAEEEHRFTEEQKTKLNQSLVFSKSGALSDEEVDTTLLYVRSMIEDIGRCIYKGDIPIKPYRYGQTTSCDYCKFKAICRFDPTNTGEDFDRIEKKNRDEVISQMKGACNGRSHKKDHSD